MSFARWASRRTDATRRTTEAVCLGGKPNTITLCGHPFHQSCLAQARDVCAGKRKRHVMSGAVRCEHRPDSGSVCEGSKDPYNGVFCVFWCLSKMGERRFLKAFRKIRSWSVLFDIPCSSCALGPGPLHVASSLFVFDNLGSRWVWLEDPITRTQAFVRRLLPGFWTAAYRRKQSDSIIRTSVYRTSS